MPTYLPVPLSLETTDPYGEQMNTQEKMLQEERELEAKLFGTPTAPETTDAVAPIVPVVPEVAPVEEVVVATALDKPTEVAPVQEREEDWKLRYTNLRSSRDQKLFEAQTSLAKAEATIATLQQNIQELLTRQPEVSEDLFKDAFTDEEREALGETAIAAMQKTANIAADAKTKAINEELKEVRAKAAQDAKANATTSATAAYQTFLSRLAKAVPDYEAIDMDPAFTEYCKGADLDGSPRIESFSAAETRGDVSTIARHMLDFKAYKDPKAAAKAALESKVEPTGNAASTITTTAKDSEVMTMSQIDAHYKKYSLGGYKGKNKEYLAMEARIDAAAAGRKITRG